ncbi:MAG: PQQ-binding-like beta-propeller repeat protein [Planctomycetes bacterium]|nr:PQQ-binding-like beta-propeller repeat protein [Planctomycetota bacterium]MCB9905823.1 PQQ-binding-like beta-propeller repeat protein [Planctomycetota bacterium]
MRLFRSLLICAAAAWFAAPGLAQASNDTYLPRSREAEAALVRGDQAWLRRGTDEAALRAALEAWYQALAETDSPAEVRLDLTQLADDETRNPWRDPHFEAGRRSESVELAVIRRLTQAGPEVRDRWRARFGELAEAAASSDSSEDWARAEADHPGTRGAFRAALRLAERSLEEGRRVGARCWLARAAVHLDLGAGSQADRDALQRRRERLDLAFGPRPAGTATADALRNARGLELRHVMQLQFVDGGRPGITRLSHGQVLIQGRGFDRGLDIVWEVGESGIGRPFEPWKLLDEQALLYGENRRGPGEDWNFQPLADGASAIMVLGRAEDLRGFEERSNTVARMLPPSGPKPGVLEWALGPSGLWTADDGIVASLEELLGAGLWEFQPEPLLSEDCLILQARQWKQERDEAGRLRISAQGEARAWALALDRRSGRVIWKHELGRGSEPRADAGIPITAMRRVRTPASPPVAVEGGRVFCGTQLGVGALLDLEDGRLLWSYLNPRRDADATGWSALPSPRAVASTEAAPPTIVWAPADGDRLLWLRGAPDPAGEGLQVFPSLAREDAEALLGADAREALILTRYGPHFTLAAYRPATGERLDAIDLGRDEEPLTDLLWSDDRALFASDRALYLFDRRRELYLLEAFPLPQTAPPNTGRLLTRGGNVQLLTPEGLWTFAVVR